MNLGLLLVALSVVLAGIFVLSPLVGSAAPYFLPGSLEMKDRRLRTKARQHLSQHLHQQIASLEAEFPSLHSRPLAKTYDRLVDRMQVIRSVAGSTITPAELDQLDDTLVSFLRLWHASTIIAIRMGTSPGESQRHIDASDKIQLHNISLIDQQNLRLARDNAVRALAERQNLVAQETATSAHLFILGAVIDELYQRVHLNPSPGIVAGSLLGVNLRLATEAELRFSADDEVTGLLHKNMQRTAHT